MKKLIAGLLACSIIGTTFTAFAADASVTIAKPTVNADKSITVTGSVTNPAEKQDITVMATGVINEDGQEKYDADKILFIDQQSDIVKADGSFEITFKLSEEISRYMVRIGGTDISTPASMAVDNEGGTPTVIWGDVNGDNAINYEDASLILQYVLNPDSVTSQFDLTNAKVSGSAVLTALDASLVAKKAANLSGFKFPVE